MPNILKNAKVVKIKIGDIVTSSAQPRTVFEREKIEKLAKSIKENGLLSPISVRRLGRVYELVAGERRLRALKMLGEDTAPCIVISANECEAAVLTVIENIQRENLNFFEEAEGIEMLIARLGLTQSSVAEKLGLSQSCVANKLRLLKLSSTEKKIILENSLTERHARALLRISDEQIRKKAALHIAKNKMNVAASEKYIDKLLSGNKKGETKFVFRDLRIFVNTINMAIETMRRAGVDAEAKKGENEAFIEYIIKIPKQVTQK